MQENALIKSPFLINFYVKSHKIKVYFYTSVLAYENRGIFLDLSLSKEKGLSYHSEQKILRINQNSIFSEFLKIVKNTLALMLSIILIIFSSQFQKWPLRATLQRPNANLYLRSWSSWTANNDKKLNEKKSCVTSQKTTF